MIRLLILLTDMAVLGISFAVVNWLVNGRIELASYQSNLIPFALLWVIFSLINRKYAITSSGSLVGDLKSIIFSNFCVVALSSLLVFGFNYGGMSRLVFLATPAVATLLEILLAGILKKSGWRLLHSEIGAYARYQTTDYAFAFYDLLIWVAAYLGALSVFYFWGRIPDRLLEAYIYLLVYSSAVSYAASLLTRKLQVKGKASFSDFLVPVLNSSAIIVIFLSMAAVAFKDFEASRLVVYSSVAVAFAIDILIISILFNYRVSAVPGDNEELHLLAFQAVLCKVREVEEIHDPRKFKYSSKKNESLYHRLKSDLSDQEIDFISLNIDIREVTGDIPLLVYAGPPEKLGDYEDDTLEILLSRKAVNEISSPGEYFAKVHGKLKDGGYFIGSARTSDLAAEKIREKYSGPVYAALAGINFFVEEFLLRMSGLKAVAGLFGIHINNSISKTEVLGRLVVCGFKNIDFTCMNDRMYFIAYKAGEPRSEEIQLYSAFINLRRLGKFGRDIKVYKFRTMFPYSEYLRDFVIRKCGYVETGDGVGKIEDDFRITEIGKFMRRYWLDELPQLINILRGEIKLVGIRPLEANCLKTYPLEFLKRRLKYKPGLLAPYAAHIHKNMDEYIEAEIKYLDDFDRRPILTDIKYFFWISWNILSGKIRSG